ncbi:uncharacterized protein LOC106154502 isoform X1 [Lingula anatina]|uniref:Uncharacterized protein LOC106154502 isoform X1 n=1 Tax=Lingula anatina TaxID=7574 RepID=A0A1S3HH16_LINAN|nr:uncharacterized protein LOC106154502 isoform X1 [Lingula anatina]|eukprot:XP_013384319.1 uncharacterized protein LOC106154502 isoform X1 [Lingula anatina]
MMKLDISPVLFCHILILTIPIMHGRNSHDDDNSCAKYVKDNITVSAIWYDLPPLIHLEDDEDKEMKGLLASLIDQVMNKCYGNVTVTYCHQGSDQYSVLQEWTNETIAVPMRRSVAEQVFQLPDDDVLFVPLIKSPGFIYLGRQDEDINPIGAAIFQAWPLALIILLAACFAGIIIWIADRLKNPEQFPKKFSSGYVEGIWWAFVTMTTVGYGDVVPKSLLAKFFGTIWIMTGIVLVTCFTATLTTSLSADQLANNVPIDLKGAMVGVLDGTEAAMLAEGLGASVTVCDNVVCLMKKLHDNANITGIMLEFHTALHELHGGNLQYVKMIPQEAMLGFYIRNVPRSRTKCFSKYIRQHQQKFDPTDEPGKKKHWSGKSADVAKSLMETGATLTILIAGWALWLFIVLVILAWECIHKGHFRKEKNASESEEAPKNRSGSQVSTVSMDPFI